MRLCSYIDTREFLDETCILDVGDHPFIRHKSFVMYFNFMLVSISEFLRLRKTREIELLDDMSEEVLVRIREGIRNTVWLSEDDMDNMI